MRGRFRWGRAIVAVALLAAVVAATASAGELRARVAPAPPTLTTRSWSPTITLTRHGKPATARLLLTLRRGAERRSFVPRAARRGSYRVRVAFPSDGRWSWTLSASRETLARGVVTVSTAVAFELPYDLARAQDGTILFTDRSRVLALDAATTRVRVYATVPGASELVSIERLADGTLFLTDLPSGRIVRIDPARRVSTIAEVRAPADLVADDGATTLWVASIADGVGVVRVDVASGRVEPFARPFQPHGIDRDAAGDFVVHDGHAVSRIDGRTGTVSPFADVDAFRLVLAPDSSVYGVEGGPAGGRVVRIAPGGEVTALVGTGLLAPHRDGPALDLGVLPSGVELAPDGAVLFTQVEPVPAIRRLDPATGLVSTLKRSG